MSVSRPLLCELHAHTTWSDGALPLRSLVDVHGAHGFDVLCVTDHQYPFDGVPGLTAETYPAYVDEIELEAVRAWQKYGLLLIPGVELTDHQEEPYRSAHALALGLRSFVRLDGGIADAMAAARGRGAAIVAAHPAGPGDGDDDARRATRRFWRELEGLRDLVDRWELVNRHSVFGWVAQERLPAVATGDFHRLEHLSTWKTLLPCERHEEAVIAFLRGSARAHLTAYVPHATLPRLAA